MKIEINRIDDAFRMEATNEAGKSIQSDGSLKIGGRENAMRPMQILLSSLGCCSSIDVISILKKQRQPLEDIKITLTGEREKDKVPALFTDIHVHFKLYGALDQKKVEQAIRLSLEQYCSVAKIVEKTANISWDYEILPS